MESVVAINIPPAPLTSFTLPSRVAPLPVPKATEVKSSETAKHQKLNWFTDAVNDNRGLCPSGWHVPSNDEWTGLIGHLGGESQASADMKLNFGWSGNGCLNGSGFSAVPGGLRNGLDSYFYGGGSAANWWSSTLFMFPYLPEAYEFALCRTLYSGAIEVNAWIWREGLSIRCIQDSE